MHQFKRRWLLIFVILPLLVGVVYSCCSCGIQTNASTMSDEELRVKNRYVHDVAFGGANDCQKALLEVLDDYSKDEVDYVTIKGYSNFLNSHLSSSVITRSEWLEKLFDAFDIEVVEDISSGYDHFVDKDYFDKSEYFVTAIQRGILSGGGCTFNPYCAATRQYVATTLVNAVGYPTGYKLSCADYYLIEDKAQAATAVNLGYFELDENNFFNPYSQVTDEDIQYILSELELLNVLEGKTVMSFGDSIMHGDGNYFEGIADLMAQRYMMTAIDYSKGGATFGKVENREQISNQILTAVQNHEVADVIFINGGTNDMRKVAPGVISEDFKYGKHGREDFASGMEYALGLLRDNFPDTPVLYIRAHDMEYGIERNELHFGTMALDICEKWDVEYADIFSQSGFDGHDEEQKSIYTVHTKMCKNGDSIHPNRLGYYKYYLPIVSEKTTQLLSSKAIS